MHVRRVTVSAFMRHDKAALDLPAKGVVVVTGPNGAGKSSWIEAVSTAFWGKTIRGSLPWREGQKGGVGVQTDRVAVIRERSAGGQSKLMWSPEGAPTEAWENNQKAQAALLSVVGSWEVWRRTSVFTASDAAHFTLSSDGERKRLLEAILGLGRFDAALDECRAAMKAATSVHGHARATLERHTGSIGVVTRWVSESRAELERLTGQAPPPGESTARLEAMRDRAAEERRTAGDEVRAFERKLGELQAALAQVERQATRLMADICPTCEQPIGEDRREHLRAEVESSRWRVEEAKAAHAEKAREAESALEELGEEVRALDDRIKDALRAGRLHREHATELERHAERLKKGEAELATLTADVERAQASAAAAFAQMTLLSTVEGVLGLRGVRAHVLARALSGVEAVANVWLGRIAGGGLKLKLRPYSEKGDGGISDAISLEVEGAGGGHGYRAASTGERRRIDVALLLALSEVAAAAVGERPGTLWVDEVFDGLDDSGVHAVCCALDALSAERAVVVITHNPALVAQLPKAQHVRVTL